MRKEGEGDAPQGAPENSDHDENRDQDQTDRSGDAGDRDEADEGDGADRDGDGKAPLDAKTTEEPKPEDADQKRPKVPAAVQRRLDKLTKRNTEAEERVRDLERRLAEWEAQGGDDEGGQRQQSRRPAALANGHDKDVDARAREIVAEQQFNQSCNDIYQKGKKEYPDFEDALNGLKSVDVMDKNFIEAAIASGNPAAVLHALGNDHDEAERVAGLSIPQMVAAMIKIATPKPAQEKPVSKAPAPIEPLSGKSGKDSSLRDDMSDDEWGRQRDAAFRH